MSKAVRENRLELVSVEMSEKLEILEEEDLRDISMVAARRAIVELGLDHPAIAGGFAAIERGAFGDTATLNVIEALVNELDERQWDLQIQVDEGEIDKSVQMEAFKKARAVQALWFALHADPLTAAQQSLYEAHAAFQSLDPIKEILDL